MNVAMLASAANIHTVRWATAIARRGVRVSLFSQHPPAPELAGEKVEVHLLPYAGMLGYARNAAAVRRAFTSSGADFLHVHYVGGYGLTALLSGVEPVMMSVWGADVYDVPERSPIHRWLVRAILQRARLISSTSEVMARQTRALGVGRPIRVVPFGVDTTLFVPEPRPVAGKIVIGTVKTLHPKYGIDTLIEAFALLSRIRPDLHKAGLQLRIVGRGEYLETYQRLARDLDIDHQVEFSGFVPHSEVPRTLGTFDIYVAASRLDSESFGVAVIEASACGVPVIVSDAGGLPEVVQDGTTGLIVPREDPAALADAISRLVDDKDLRARMGRAGRDHVQAHYEWGKCVDEMLACYEAMNAAMIQVGGSRRP
ncbi:putative glycosyltransferase [Sphingomonas changbaiensis NBRC 104936]|uniref:Putative glycosyltransferase n=1 Tax=Sphingomonas changbaiensis NBRC 104936 TaxID=1219043 RepID=A0A0E9MNQ2_9SPHN|nr:glycosyltransferase [Sphingomonas changbaiensis]GAO39051.1 putative glycosyltransferase [Sphingomonas changbaiensis NBRC 104936]